MNNLALDARYSGVVKEMRDAVQQWRSSSDDVTPAHDPKPDKTDRFTGKVVAVSKSSSANDKQELHE